MRQKKYVAILSSLFILALTCGVYAESVELVYRPLENKIRYKSQFVIENITDTDIIHVSTRTGVTSFFDASVTQGKANLLLKVVFKNITLDDFQRELQILDNEKRIVGAESRGKMEADLQNAVLNKFVATIIDVKGKVAERFNSPGLKDVALMNLLATPDQLFIPLPEGQIQIGAQWKEIFTASVAPFNFGPQFTTAVKYTYLGTENQQGITCYKINASLEMIKEGPINGAGEQIAWGSHTGGGTLYFAVDGNYLVKGILDSDLSLMIVAQDSKGKNYVNFVKSVIRQNVELVVNNNQLSK